jgi:hypothetical protein
MNKILHNPKSYAPAVFIPCWLIQVSSKFLSHGAKLVYGRLTQWCNETGQAYRSAKQLAEELGMCESSVEKFQKELRDVNLIGTFHPQAGGVNHFEFYDHPWMHDQIKEQLSYKEDRYDPPYKLTEPPVRTYGTPPYKLTDINIKEIKVNKITNKTLSTKDSNLKKNNLSIAEMCNQNPHQIPEDLLQEWKRSRKKPITQRVINAFNNELLKIAKAGIDPIIAVNKMLDKQWQTVELGYFEKDIASLKGGNKKNQTEGDALSRVLAKYNKQQGNTFDELGNLYDKH